MDSPSLSTTLLYYFYSTIYESRIIICFLLLYTAIAKLLNMCSTIYECESMLSLYLLVSQSVSKSNWTVFVNIEEFFSLPLRCFIIIWRLTVVGGFSSFSRRSDVQWLNLIWQQEELFKIYFNYLQGWGWFDYYD